MVKGKFALKKYKENVRGLYVCIKINYGSIDYDFGKKNIYIYNYDGNKVLT